VVKDDRLRWMSEGDVESAPTAPRLAKARASAASAANSAAAKVLGVVPLRVWLIVAYLSLLHIAVMISFTRSHDINKLCEMAPAVKVHGDLILP
jgi:hypothetical protein